VPRILSVEDNDDNVYMLKSRLERKGYEGLVEGDGEQGIAAAKEHRPVLILMDLSQSVMDGWEATRVLKADPLTQSIPIIALTAHATSGDREKALSVGRDDYDTKPVDFQRLLGKLEALLT
jgi:two-component system cell cycle response regulator DivK